MNRKLNDERTEQHNHYEDKKRRSIDIEKAVLDKIELKEKKYPVELAKDNAINLLSCPIISTGSSY